MERSFARRRRNPRAVRVAHHTSRLVSPIADFTLVSMSSMGDRSAADVVDRRQERPRGALRGARRAATSVDDGGGSAAHPLRAAPTIRSVAPANSFRSRGRHGPVSAGGTLAQSRRWAKESTFDQVGRRFRTCSAPSGRRSSTRSPWRSSGSWIVSSRPNVATNRSTIMNRTTSGFSFSRRSK